MMWASMIVSSESCIPSWVNSSSADTPATISGVTSGISIRMFAPPTQRVARAHEPEREQRAERPSPTSIVTVAISMLATQRSRSDSFSKKRWYHSKLEARRSAAATWSS